VQNVIKATPTGKYHKGTIRKRKLATHDRAYLANLIAMMGTSHLSSPLDPAT
jgi:hypothetical protein